MWKWKHKNSKDESINIHTLDKLNGMIEKWYCSKWYFLLHAKKYLEKSSYLKIGFNITSDKQ